jgi:hypothetical protein
LPFDADTFIDAISRHRRRFAAFLRYYLRHFSCFQLSASIFIADFLADGRRSSLLPLSTLRLLHITPATFMMPSLRRFLFAIDFRHYYAFR